MTAKTEPKLRFHSSFFWPGLCKRHPYRTLSGILIFLFFARDAYLWGGAGAALTLFILTTGILFVAPTILWALDCRYTAYTFFSDRLEMHEHFFLSDKAKIPYHTITSVKVKPSPLQKRKGLADIIVNCETRTGQTFTHILPDVANARQKAQQIKKLVSDFRHQN